MGIIDQRGDRRRVVTDGNRQAQGEDEQPRAVEARVSTPAGEQRGIRLLPDVGPGRTPPRVGISASTSSAPESGRPLRDAMEPADAPEPEAVPGADRDRVENPRQFRCDEAHPPRPQEPRGDESRVPGPLSARVAQRHRRSSPGTIRLGAGSSAVRPETGGNDLEGETAVAS